MFSTTGDRRYTGTHGSRPCAIPNLPALPSSPKAREGDFTPRKRNSLAEKFDGGRRENRTPPCVTTVDRFAGSFHDQRVAPSTSKTDALRRHRSEPDGPGPTRTGIFGVRTARSFRLSYGGYHKGPAVPV